MAAVLADWQLDVAGVVIGHGTDVLIEDIQGLGTAPLRTGDVPIPGEDGVFAGSISRRPARCGSSPGSGLPRIRLSCWTALVRSCAQGPTKRFA